MFISYYPLVDYFYFPNPIYKKSITVQNNKTLYIKVQFPFILKILYFTDFIKDLI